MGGGHENSQDRPTGIDSTDHRQTQRERQTDRQSVGRSARAARSPTQTKPSVCAAAAARWTVSQSVHSMFLPPAVPSPVPPLSLRRTEEQPPTDPTHPPHRHTPGGGQHHAAGRQAGRGREAGRGSLLGGFCGAPLSTARVIRNEKCPFGIGDFIIESGPRRHRPRYGVTECYYYYFTVLYCFFLLYCPGHPGLDRQKSIREKTHWGVYGHIMYYNIFRIATALLY